MVRLDRGRPKRHLRGAAGVAAAVGMKGQLLTMAQGIERKLTTILAADVDGYSRLMEADETAAMGALKEFAGGVRTPDRAPSRQDRQHGR